MGFERRGGKEGQETKQNKSLKRGSRDRETERFSRVVDEKSEIVLTTGARLIVVEGRGK